MKMSKDKNPENNEGFTPLHLAAADGRVELCRLIMDVIEDIFPKSKKKTTPLHLAARGGHHEVRDLIFTYAART